MHRCMTTLRTCVEVVDCYCNTSRLYLMSKNARRAICFFITWNMVNKQKTVSMLLCHTQIGHDAAGIKKALNLKYVKIQYTSVKTKQGKILWTKQMRHFLKRSRLSINYIKISLLRICELYPIYCYY